MTNLQIIKEDVIEQRELARREAKTGGDTVRSRGVWLGASYDGISLPNTAGEVNEVKLTAKSIQSTIERIIDDKLGEGKDVKMVRFHLWGGWDAADSPIAMRDGDCLPCASDWSGTIEFDYQMNVIED